MSIRSIDDIRRDHDDYRRWQVRPNKFRVGKPMPANWRDIGLLLKYVDRLAESNQAMESTLGRIGEYLDVEPGDVQGLIGAIVSAVENRK